MIARLEGRGLRRASVGPVDVSVGTGELIALVGTAADGPTTVLRALTGTSRVDDGAVYLHIDEEVLELTRADARTRAWVRGQYFAVLDGAPAVPPRRAAVDAVARLAGVAEEPARLGLTRLGLGALVHEPVGRLRAGAARRMALAAALLAPVPVTVLDEPLRGLDETGTECVMAWITERLDAGAAILTSATRGDVFDRAAARTVATTRS